MPNNPEARSGNPPTPPVAGWQAIVTNRRLHLTRETVRNERNFYQKWFPDPDNITQEQVVNYFKWFLTECSDAWDILANGTFTVHPTNETIKLQHRP